MVIMFASQYYFSWVGFFFFFFLFVFLLFGSTLRNEWDLKFPTRDWTQAACSGNMGVPTAGLPGKSMFFVLPIKNRIVGNISKFHFTEEKTENTVVNIYQEKRLRRWVGRGIWKVAVENKGKTCQQLRLNMFFICWFICYWIQKNQCLIITDHINGY